MRNKIILVLLAVVSFLCISGCTFDPNLDAEYTISFVKNDNCDISLSKTSAKKNEEIEVTVENITDGYELYKITANGYKIDDFKFLMPAEDVTIVIFLKREGEVAPTTEFSVNVVASEYAQIKVEKEKYSIGETVSIDYMCKGYYVLDKFYVDGIEIDGNTFEMPNRDVSISASFTNVIGNPTCSFIVTSSGNDGRYYSYFTYGETGINVKVIADDRFIYGTEISDNPAYQDNIEIILSPKSTTAGYDANKTYKFLVSCTGNGYVQVANSTNSWKTVTLSNNQYTSSAVIKSYDNKDGYDGYEINFFVSYDVFGLTKDTAVGNMSACVATRNVNTYQKSEWDPGIWSFYSKNGCQFSNISTHPVINSDGTFGERS